MAFPTLLKQWRKLRRMSQLELALEADVSTRHVSFLETGRARPSQIMVVQLMTALQLPQAAGQAFLHAAGFQQRRESTVLPEEELQAINEAMKWTLDRHDPYPAVVLDRQWRMLYLNNSATMLLGAFGLKQNDSLLDALVSNQDVHNAIENLHEIAAHTRLRLSAELSHYGEDETLATAINAIDETFGRSTVTIAENQTAIVPLRFSLNGAKIHLFSTLSQFTSSWDVAVSELRFELFYPVDEYSRKFLLSMA